MTAGDERPKINRLFMELTKQGSLVKLGIMSNSNEERDAARRLRNAFLGAPLA
jgi:hypothetical protein